VLLRVVKWIAVTLALLALVGVRLDLPAADVDGRYATGSSKFETLPDGTRMHYWDRGDASSPVLVLLHGSYDCANTWELWAPLLDRDFRLIVPDLPAHGLTGKTPADDYSIEAMVAAVHDLLGKLGIAHASFAGNSMGGNTAWMYAAAHPEQVERLVLIDSSGYPNDNSVGPRSENAVTRLLYRYGNPSPLIRSGFREAVLDDAIITSDRVERWVSYIRRAGSRDAHHTRAQQRGIANQPFERLRQLQAPTLILWGDKDPLVPVADAKRFDTDIPNSRAIIYPNIGHMPQLEHAEQSAKDVRGFLLGAAF